MLSDSPRIVVINDDLVQLHLLSRVLEADGYDVGAYVESTEALARLEEEPRVDLFVVDLHMPQIDGWKVCRLLRSPDFLAYNETPILIVSATFMGVDVEAINTDIGADGFLPMPLNRVDLLEHVRGLLSGVRPRNRSHVLIIEDNEAVSKALSRTFSRNGYEIHSARSIAEAETLWVEIGPDLVLLDYHLPDGKGLELLTRLHSPSDRTVVLVMTGDADPELPIQILKRGADGYVRKPFDPSFLVELASKARRERSLLRVETLLETRTQELRTSEARYRSLFDAIPDLVLTLDAGDRVVGMNEEAASALGPYLSDVEGEHISTFLVDEQFANVAAQLEAVRESGTACFETVLTQADQLDLTVEVTAAAPKGADVGAVIMVARDLTERRRAEEERRRLDAQVQHAQRLESLGVLAGGIAHDFNNLLVGVMGNASLALLDSEQGTPVHECITQIETAARRAAELTQQILTFSGKGESAMSPQDLSSVVSEMGQLLAPAVSKKAKLAYRLRQDLPAVRADASQLRQVIMNLIMNASDALGDSSGRIEVRTKVSELSADTISHYTLGEGAEPGAYVSVEVSDDGCGMDKETKRQIFDPFFTTKFAGRGLGLAATLGIIRAHAGLVSVESSPGEGTCFRVLLPAAVNEVAPGDDWPAGTAGLNGGGVGGTILVVDDEPSVRMLASRSLLRAGYRVVEAENGDRTLDLLTEGIDLVVLDLTMPGMTGMEVLEQIRRRRPDLPVLLSSGYTDDVLPLGTIVPGLTEFMRKPYSPRQLLDGIFHLSSEGGVPEAGAAEATTTAPAKVWRASG